MTRVLVVSDVRLYREGLTRLLGGSEALDVVGSAADVGAGIDCALESRPDVVVLHLCTDEGTQAVRRIVERIPDAEIVVLALRDDATEVIAYAEAGAAGYLALEGSLTELIDTIIDVANGRVRMSPHVTRALLRQLYSSARDRFSASTPALTHRELEVLDLVERGLANKEIARTLCIGLPTVKAHVHAILKKVGLRTRSEAGAWARAHLAGRLDHIQVPSLKM